MYVVENLAYPEVLLLRTAYSTNYDEDINKWFLFNPLVERLQYP